MSRGGSEPRPDCENLHARLLAGDPIASADLFACHAASLTRQLATSYRTTDADLIHDAIVTALLDHAERPERFDPSRRSLGGYLRMAAERDLLNLRAKHRRRLERETVGDPVELQAQGRNIGSEPLDRLGENVADQEAADEIVARAMSVTRTEEERIVMRLVLAEEKATAVVRRRPRIGGHPTGRATRAGLRDQGSADQASAPHARANRWLNQSTSG